MPATLAPGGSDASSLATHTHHTNIHLSKLQRPKSCALKVEAMVNAKGRL